MIDALFVLCAYLLGSFSSAVIVCRLMKLPDPRTRGSGNPGATNVLRHGGKKAAFITLCLDISKGVIAVGFAKGLSVSPTTLAAIALAVFLGHLYPIFFQFRGGKGVATAFGVFIILSGWLGIVTLITWLSVVAIFRYVSLAAVLTALVTPAYFFWFTQERIYVLLGIAISLLIIWRHRSNIYNLLHGQEDKIGTH